MLDRLGQAPPVRREGRLVGADFGEFAGSPRPARQFHRAAKEAFRRPAPREKGAVGALGEKHRADFFGTRLLLSPARKSFGVGAGGGAAALAQGAGEAGGRLRAADRRANVHQRLREIAGAARRRQLAGEFLYRAAILGDGGGETGEARDDAGDIAVDRRRRLAEGDGGDRRRRIGADAGQGAQGGFVWGKSSRRGDRPRRRVKIARPRIITEAGEGVHHLLDLGRRQRRHVRPAGQELGEIGRGACCRGLLQQDFGEPYAIGVDALAGLGAPGQRPGVGVEPAKSFVGERGGR